MERKPSIDENSDIEKIAEANFERNLQEFGINIISEQDLVKIKPHIGEGGFGKVYKGKYFDNIVAVKKIKLVNKFSSVFNDILNEILVILKADCKDIPKFYGIMKNKKNVYHLVFEFLDGKNLKDIFMTLDDKANLTILRDLALILDEFHRKLLIHRDIKPGNVMIESGNKVRLIDFGVSKIAQHTSTFTKAQMGTVVYMSPEIFLIDSDKFINNTEENVRPVPVSIKSDIWALGVMISEIFSKVKPWSNFSKNKKFSDNLIIQALKRQTKFPIPDNLDQEIRNLVEKATSIDPEKRPSAKEVQEIIDEIIKQKYSSGTEENK